MRQRVFNKRLYQLTLGVACASGMGMAGCSRPGADLAREDPGARAAMDERAAEAIQRSRQELIAQDLRAARDRGVTIAQAPASASGGAGARTASAPDVAARPGMRMPRMLTARKHDAETFASDVEDPFLAQRAVADKQPTAESKDPIQDFLREQRPVGLDGATMASHEQPAPSSTATSAPSSSSVGQSARPLTPEEKAAARKRAIAEQKAAIAQKRDREEAALKARALADAERRAAADRALKELAGQRSPAIDQAIAKSVSPKTPAAKTTETSQIARADHSRSFPPTWAESAADNASPVTSDDRPARTAANPLAFSAPKVKEQDGAAESGAQATELRAQIAAILEDAQVATEQGEFTRALELVADAQRLASENQYVFAKDEQQPADAIALIAHEIEDAARLNRGEFAAGSPRNRPRFSNASFSAGQHPGFSEALGRESSAGFAQNDAGGTTAFSASLTETSDRPVWPDAPQSGLEETDQQWLPSAGIASIPNRDARVSQADVEEQQFAEDVSRQLAAVERSDATVGSAVGLAPSPPLVAVELGAPLAFVPDSAIPSDDARSGISPRLIAPPPLSIGEISQDGAADWTEPAASVERKKSRAAWYVVLGGLAGVGLLVFRRRVYGGAQGST